MRSPGTTAGRPMRGVSPARGFTIVELIVVVLIVAVLGALAAPSFVSLIRSQRIKTATNDLVSTLVFARSEAVKRNLDVTVSPSGTGWKDGWTVTYVDGGVQTARSQPALNQLTVGLTTAPAAASIVFGGGGRANTSGTFIINNNPLTSGVDARCVEVRPDGLPRVWIERGGDNDCTND